MRKCTIGGGGGGVDDQYVPNLTELQLALLNEDYGANE